MVQSVLEGCAYCTLSPFVISNSFLFTCLMNSCCRTSSEALLTRRCGQRPAQIYAPSLHTLNKVLHKTELITVALTLYLHTRFPALRTRGHLLMLRALLLLGIIHKCPLCITLGVHQRSLALRLLLMLLDLVGIHKGLA